LQTEGLLKIDLKYYKSNLQKYLQKVCADYTKQFAEYFSIHPDFFDQLKINFSIDTRSIDLKKEIKKTIKFGKSESIFFDKPENSEELLVAIQTQTNIQSRLTDNILKSLVEKTIVQYFLTDIFPSSFIITSERTSIALFYKELDINKNALVEDLESLLDSDKEKAIDLLHSRRSRYAEPIYDNIDTIRNYDTLNKRKSFLLEKNQTYRWLFTILQDLIGGTYTEINGQVFYQPQKENDRDTINLPIYIASSAIKSLFLLELYIKHIAKKGDLLIIDEPELNLHPDNQRKIAKLLARLVNAGVKILLTTHSDYLIRELNNCIMLSNEVENKESIMKKASIVREDILRPEQVKAFVIKKDHIIHEVTIDKYGMNMGIFDELISKANALFDEIYYNIKE
jgi:predicted ATP-dependent endonuclease of OLD family